MFELKTGQHDKCSIAHAYLAALIIEHDELRHPYTWPTFQALRKYFSQEDTLTKAEIELVKSVANSDCPVSDAISTLRNDNSCKLTKQRINFIYAEAAAYDRYIRDGLAPIQLKGINADHDGDMEFSYSEPEPAPWWTWLLLGVGIGLILHKVATVLEWITT